MSTLFSEALDKSDSRNWYDAECNPGDRNGAENNKD